jgi:hypothetical protein
MQLRRSYNRLRLYLCPIEIYEPTGRSVCSLNFIVPVETVSPPNLKLNALG